MSGSWNTVPWGDNKFEVKDDDKRIAIVGTFEHAALIAKAPLIPELIEVCKLIVSFCGRESWADDPIGMTRINAAREVLAKYKE